ncbi:ribosome biogenesis GTPase [Alicyclobacillus sacchari]|uniref:Small ribosomal subunit biogenesis GTPase RsgA n=1 Tax=Alicyclobacillus sacchari TaxID=392010 RepID=A0A4R8LPS5_9BACL|nr:ribosome small subunit-dependent GTPase A [Alicyclobacillus sacchari]TDY46612.1 ribosome biogenesis GTPase [Alicyclobacillus sacchari]GMA58852.1 putative ribosome biogenesis GTPase RsgA [Alicyclobacillus sacchari]
MAEGRVIRAISGFFDVQDGEQLRRCRARGVFKKRGTTVLVGDRVKYDPIGSHEGVIVEVLPRATELVRPPIANVDHVVVACSFVTPDLNLYMLDKTLVAAASAGVEATIVLTKSDLATPGRVTEIVERYRAIGYETYAIAAKFGNGVEQVRSRLKGRISVFAGPSGAGKSTLANALLPGLHLQMGEVSEKIGRGKQTTRHVELFQMDEASWVADAPGFSQLQLEVASRDLREYFMDFAEPAQACSYRGCLHLDEEGCGVKAAVDRALIASTRYVSYRQLYQEIREQELNEYS